MHKGNNTMSESRKMKIAARNEANRLRAIDIAGYEMANRRTPAPQNVTIPFTKYFKDNQND